MDFMTVGLICIAALLLLLGLGLPVGLTFIASGAFSCFLMLNAKATLTMLGQSAYYSIASPTWACIPLFILMGSIAAEGRLAEKVYGSINVLAAKIPGSLGIATCFACAAFGAISGSSIATTAIFGRLALPEMERHGYPTSFSVGCIASAGTFASMVPPSMMMIIYALFTQQSVAKLFAAGIIPGLLTATVYATYIYLYAKKQKHKFNTVNEDVLHKTRKEKTEAVIAIWPMLVIAGSVLGGIYTGVFTPTEAAAVGSLLTLFLGWFQGGIRRLSTVNNAFKDAASTTAMLFLINVGALYYSKILAMSRIPTELANSLTHAQLAPLTILLGVLVIMFLLGMIVVPVGIYALTLPIFFPLITSLGYDPIWFGVIALKLTEIGSVTPPVGLNAFAMKGVAPPHVSIEEIFKGVWPFCICDIVVLVLLVLFPGIVTWLPDLLLG